MPAKRTTTKTSSTTRGVKKTTPPAAKKQSKRSKPTKPKKPIDLIDTDESDCSPAAKKQSKRSKPTKPKKPIDPIDTDESDCSPAAKKRSKRSIPTKGQKIIDLIDSDGGETDLSMDDSSEDECDEDLDEYTPLGDRTLSDDIDSDHHDEDDDDRPLHEVVISELERIPVFEKVAHIVQTIKEVGKASKFHIKLKVLHMEKANLGQRSGARSMKATVVYLCDSRRKETKTTAAKVAKLLKVDCEDRIFLLQKLLRITIWEVELAEVQKKIKVLDIVKIRRNGGVSIFQDTPQINCQLQSIEVVHD